MSTPGHAGRSTVLVNFQRAPAELHDQLRGPDELYTWLRFHSIPCFTTLAHGLCTELIWTREPDGDEVQRALLSPLLVVINRTKRRKRSVLFYSLASTSCFFFPSLPRYVSLNRENADQLVLALFIKLCTSYEDLPHARCAFCFAGVL